MRKLVDKFGSLKKEVRSLKTEMDDKFKVVDNKLSDVKQEVASSKAELKDDMRFFAIVGLIGMIATAFMNKL